MNDFNLTQLDLNAMKQVDIQLVDPNTLVDINDIHIDANLPLSLIHIFWINGCFSNYFVIAQMFCDNRNFP